MIQTEKRFDVNIDALYNAITLYENYPLFVPGCIKALVQKNQPDTVVQYTVSVLNKEIRYTLSHVQNPKDYKVSWTLVEGDWFSKNEGSWSLQSVDDHTTIARYSLEIKLRLFLPKSILNQLVDKNIDELLGAFEKRAKNYVK